MGRVPATTDQHRRLASDPFFNFKNLKWLANAVTTVNAVHATATACAAVEMDVTALRRITLASANLVAIAAVVTTVLARHATAIQRSNWCNTNVIDYSDSNKFIL